MSDRYPSRVVSAGHACEVLNELVRVVGGVGEFVIAEEGEMKQCDVDAFVAQSGMTESDIQRTSGCRVKKFELDEARVRAIVTDTVKKLLSGYDGRVTSLAERVDALEDVGLSADEESVEEMVGKHVHRHLNDLHQRLVAVETRTHDFMQRIEYLEWRTESDDTVTEEDDDTLSMDGLFRRVNGLETRLSAMTGRLKDLGIDVYGPFVSDTDACVASDCDRSVAQVSRMGRVAVPSDASDKLVWHSWPSRGRWVLGKIDRNHNLIEGSERAVIYRVWCGTDRSYGWKSQYAFMAWCNSPRRFESGDFRKFSSMALAQCWVEEEACYRTEVKLNGGVKDGVVDERQA